MKFSWSKQQDDGSYAVWASSKSEKELSALKVGQKVKVVAKSGAAKDVVLEEQIREPKEKDGDWISLWKVESNNKQQAPKSSGNKSYGKGSQEETPWG